MAAICNPQLSLLHMGRVLQRAAPGGEGGHCGQGNGISGSDNVVSDSWEEVTGFYYHTFHPTLLLKSTQTADFPTLLRNLHSYNVAIVLYTRIDTRQNIKRDSSQNVPDNPGQHPAIHPPSGCITHMLSLS